MAEVAAAHEVDALVASVRAAVLSAAFKDELIAALGDAPDATTRKRFDDDASGRLASDGLRAWLAAGGAFDPDCHLADVRGGRPVVALTHDVAWLHVFEGTPAERRAALDFWSRVPPPDGVSDALAEAYLEAGPRAADPELRACLGLYTGHAFSEAVGLRLAARFSADPTGERDLAPAALRCDPHGDAWQALVRLVLDTHDVPGLYRLFDAAYQAERADDFFAMLRGRPADTLRALARVLPQPMRTRLHRLTGARDPAPG